MSDSRGAVALALACFLTAVAIAACGEADRVQIATLTPAPAVQEAPRPATPAPSFPSPAAALPSPAVPTPTAAPSPSPSPTATPSPTAPPPGCTPEAVLSRLRPSLVRVVNDRGQGRFSVGTGYAVASGGQLITNEHVVNGAVQLSVVLADGRQLPARVLRSDEGRDLALLHVPGAALPPVRFSQGPAPAAGQRVFAVGFPQSAAPTLEPTLMSGQILQTELISGATFLRTDVPTGVGASGSPLVTACGEVVGIVSSGAPQTAGITFAVARQEVEAFLAGAPPLRPGGSMPPTTATATPTVSGPGVGASPSVPSGTPTRTPAPAGRGTARP